ncbi:MAG: hypothetical protein R2745_13100 [Vicinamibacterales bacterium]
MAPITHQPASTAVDDPPAFTAQASAAWVYYALAPGSSTPDRCTAFVPPADGGLPITLSLAASWALRGGVYVLLGRAPSNDRVFLDACRAWMSRQPDDTTALVWLENPQDPPAAWRTQAIAVPRRTPGGGTTARTVRVALLNYAVVADTPLPIALDPALPGFRLGAGVAGALRLAIAGGERAFPFADGVRVSLAGRERALLTGAVPLGPPAAGEPDALDVLDVGLRYFYPAPGAAAGPALASYRCAVFDRRTEGVTLDAALDVAEPWSVRSGFAFAEGTPALASSFRTTRGAPVFLTPVDCRLRFVARPAADGEPASEASLAPAGRCLATPPGGVKDGQLLCGLSAAEAIPLPETGVHLAFVEDCPACAPLFAPPGHAAPPGPDDAPRLSTAATTSWVSIGREGATLPYHAQPHAAPMFGPAPAAAAGATPILPFFPVVAANLPAWPPGAPRSPLAAPLAPLAGCRAADAAGMTAFEEEILSQERRDRIVGAPARPAAPRVRARAARAAAPAADVKVVTPGGWISTFSADGATWRSVQFARLGTAVLALHDIDGPLRAALLASQQFLVVSDPAALQAHFQTDSRLDLDGWVFDVAPDRWAEQGTMLIVKSSPRAVAALAGDIATWTLPDAFNTVAEAAQADLLAFIDDAREAAADEAAAPEGAMTGYAHFVAAVLDDPTWNGVLFLRARVPGDALPAALDGLRPGLQPHGLRAHHVGIAQSRVHAVSGSLEADDASVFALVDYHDDPRPPGLPPADLSFQVLDLTAQFANSALRNFGSRVIVVPARLFGAPVTGSDEEFGNALVLTGACQRRQGRPVYVFHNERWNTFRTDDAVLAQVVVARVEMAGLTMPGGSAGTETVTTFTLGGTLGFRAPAAGEDPPSDLFGFDAIGFSGLTLTMRFPTEAPGAAAFSMDATGVALDAGAARAREGSLPRRFPLTARTLANGTAAADPWSLGYLPVRLPRSDVQPLSGDWFGVVADLDLGTPGALAAAGDLTASLGLFWSPDPRAPHVAVGLRLPGTSGDSKTLSLMDVLRLSVFAAELLPADGAFLLKLTGLTLKLMGKTFPPAGAFDMYIFGDPDPGSRSNALGWYGAYRKTSGPSGGEDGHAASAAAHGYARRQLSAPSTGRPPTDPPASMEHTR